VLKAIGQECRSAAWPSSTTPTDRVESRAERAQIEKSVCIEEAALQPAAGALPGQQRSRVTASFNQGTAPCWLSRPNSTASTGVVQWLAAIPKAAPVARGARAAGTFDANAPDQGAGQRERLSSPQQIDPSQPREHRPPVQGMKPGIWPVEAPTGHWPHPGNQDSTDSAGQKTEYCVCHGPARHGSGKSSPL